MLFIMLRMCTTLLCIPACAAYNQCSIEVIFHNTYCDPWGSGFY
jgi:hypothetical protein